jgi:ubiquinone/menaquinone biosynthesis C-methylase UbiE
MKKIHAGSALLTAAFIGLAWKGSVVHSLLAFPASSFQKRTRGGTAFFATVATSTRPAAPPQPDLLRNGADDDDLDDIALRENAKFKCDESVEFWRQFNVVDDADSRRMINNVLRPHLFPAAGAGRGGDNAHAAAARAYWLYHLLRVGYFAGNAATGLFAFRLYEAVTTRTWPDFTSTTNVVQTAGPLLLAEAFLSMEQNWKWVEKGILNYPWDATIQADPTNPQQRVRLQLNHKQSNPLFVLSETARLVQDSIAIWGRRTRLEGKSAGIWLDRQGTTSSSDLYPSYYLNDFHYQQDGWMSSTSAERYEVGTETLFLGRQDSMQRQTLVPIRKRYNKSQEGQQPSSSPRTMLEIACGTGRFATFARDNFPTTNMTLVDLSPFYLEKAKEHDQHWRSQRGREAMKIATNGQQEAPDTTQFIIANAERLPFSDGTFDVVTSVYLFHELPHEARVNVAAEMARVCRPGGLVVLSDSMQEHDRPKLLIKARKGISDFSNLNEPHYESYLGEDLPALFEANGLVPDEKYMNSRTKTMSFVKKSIK